MTRKMIRKFWDCWLLPWPYPFPIFPGMVRLAAVRMGRMDGQNLIVNPTFEQQTKSDLDLTVAGTKSKINMLEAGAKQSAGRHFR